MFKKVRLFFLFLTGATVLIMTSQTTKAETTHLILDTTKGQIEIELKPDLAPNHVARITELAAEGFYDGIIFHRVIPGFMAQTGDPTGTGMGGSGQKIDAEFTDYQYIEGTVGMARSMNPDSGDSQFFICFDGCGHLTGQYTVWGQVSRGMEVVHEINAGEPPAEPDSIVSTSLVE
ncbi:MAG: peptidylprolyl isomerase [Alphaproteobacteria bacterium]|mgnify:FL=1|nr:peptidylprolyl isomerase [Alphaproteobacteria bacterium]MBL6776861.1 peptidylprolyl isomerase [Alphaproteobacteria bacterium]